MRTNLLLAVCMAAALFALPGTAGAKHRHVDVQLLSLPPAT
jgi:hypothetical protein